MKSVTKIFALIALFLVVNKLDAQSYNSAIGLRFGYPTSVSYKTFLNEKSAVEASSFIPVN